MKRHPVLSEFLYSTFAALVIIGGIMFCSSMARAEDGLPAPAGYQAFSGNKDCVTAETAAGRLGEALKVYGGDGYALVQGIQQRFADVWRKRLGLPSVEVALVLIWKGPVSSTVSEFDKHECWATITTMPTEKLRSIMEEVAKSVHRDGDPGRQI